MINRTGSLLICLGLLGLCGAHGQAPDVDLSQQAVVTTSEGTFVLSLYADKAPRHVRRFLELAAAGAYDRGIIHHVIPWEITQGGPTGETATQLQSAPAIPAEIAGIGHLRGAVSAIPAPGEAGQSSDHFFICLSPQPALDGLYTVFGRVADGDAVLDALQDVEVEGEIPRQRVELRRVRLIRGR